MHILLDDTQRTTFCNEYGVHIQSKDIPCVVQLWPDPTGNQRWEHISYSPKQIREIIETFESIATPTLNGLITPPTKKVVEKEQCLTEAVVTSVNDVITLYDEEFVLSRPWSDILHDAKVDAVMLPQLIQLFTDSGWVTTRLGDESILDYEASRK